MSRSRLDQPSSRSPIPAAMAKRNVEVPVGPAVHPAADRLGHGGAKRNVHVPVAPAVQDGAREGRLGGGRPTIVNIAPPGGEMSGRIRPLCAGLLAAATTAVLVGAPAMVHAGITFNLLD
jgi:hypothetical protein